MLLDVWALLQILGGRDNALLISPEAAFDRGSGAKNVAQREKLGEICVVCWRGWVWGVYTVQDEENEASLLSFTKSHLHNVNNTLLIATM